MRSAVCLLAADWDFAVAVLTTESQVTLPCRAHSVQGVQYRKISWYKVCILNAVTSYTLRLVSTVLFGVFR